MQEYEKNINSRSPVKLAISIGEPAGIGADLLIKLLNQDNTVTKLIQQNKIQLITYCDPDLLYQRAKLLNFDLEIINIQSSDLQCLSESTNPTILPNFYKFVYNINTNNSKNNYSYIPGKLDTKTASNTINHLKQAAIDCMSDLCNALITGPIQKSNINSIDKNFMGHTEYLEQLCSDYFNKPYKSIMMLASNYHKVALVTTHLPLKKIFSYINKASIIKIAHILNTELQTKYGYTNPHIYITGLNPHAGENGHLGSEEHEIIVPAIKKLQSMGINISGPYPADSLFSKEFNESDIILAMYHDQGLTGFKARAFNQAANITLGLPIIRTSVDHGTALELAGTGNISTNSLEFAIQSALDIYTNKQHSKVTLNDLE